MMAHWRISVIGLNVKYKVILADPPWSYSNTGKNGSAARIYPTMSDADILALPVSDLADDNAVLLLWATWPKLTQACLPTIEAWGFEYKTAFPWVKITDISHDLWGELKIKVPYGVGFWARGTSEPLLIATRGNPKPPSNSFIGLLSPNLHHSRKPDEVYDYAESLPGPYLELFARRKRPGWHVWGNEVQSDIALNIS